VLGPLEVREGSNVLDVPGRQERALLALLLTAPGRVFSVPAIVAGIWADEPPSGAEKTVQSYVSRLRRALPGNGASVVLTRSPGYLAAVDPRHVDAERFRTMAAAGRRDLRVGRPEAAAAELRDALGLWRGEAYAEFDAPFAVAERTALEELRLAAVEDRIAADLDLGAGTELVAELETLVGRHPWRERLWAQLMTALYRSGRQGDALGAFQRARTALVDELGIDPGPDLRAVEALVLAQDPELLGVDRSLEVLRRR
jgi:DNA-binding SARP family transcriptional activator